MKNISINTTSDCDKGFTIIELMVASLLFTVILVSLTAAVITITRSYVKGLIASQTQDTSRNVVNVFSQAIQFNSGTFRGPFPAVPAAGQVNWFCIGNRVFAYAYGQQLVDGATFAPHQTDHVLVEAVSQTCPTAPPVLDTLVSSQQGIELLRPRMRLSQLQVTPMSSDTYQISLEIAYGEDDLLASPTNIDGTTACITQNGDQFCDTASLTTIAQRRSH